jgi:hypothetical protein
MKQLMLVLAGVSALAACSGGREQRALRTDRIAEQPDLTLPDTLSRQDTSVSLSSRTEQRASPADRQAEENAGLSKAAPNRARRRAARVASGSRRQPVDTTVRAYAPTAARTTDSLQSGDTNTVASAVPPGGHHYSHRDQR